MALQLKSKASKAPSTTKASEASKATSTTKASKAPSTTKAGGVSKVTSTILFVSSNRVAPGVARTLTAM